MTEVFTDLICRPPRRRYTLKELGPVDFCLGEDRCTFPWPWLSSINMRSRVSCMMPSDTFTANP